MVVAGNMDLGTAIILIKALFNEYYNDNTMRVSIEKEVEEKEKTWLDSI